MSKTCTKPISAAFSKHVTGPAGPVHVQVSYWHREEGFQIEYRCPSYAQRSSCPSEIVPFAACIWPDQIARPPAANDVIGDAQINRADGDHNFSVDPCGRFNEPPAKRGEHTLRSVDDANAPAIEIVAVGALHSTSLTEQQVKETERFRIGRTQERRRFRRRDAFGIPS